MGMTGDFAALRRFIDKVGGLATGDIDVAGQIIDEAMGPIRALVDAEFSAGTDPYGAAWQPLKGGGQPFAGSDGAGRVQISKDGSVLRGSPAYPMHFHQEGTHGGGRKAQRRLGAALKRQGAGRGDIKAAKAELRARGMAGGFHDPPREVVPTDGEGIPAEWEKAIRTAATKVMAASVGATPKGGG
jgi:hypothetical protein